MAFHGNKDREEMPDRIPYDYYPTPPLVTVALLNHLRIPKSVPLWEPASGEGHISKVLTSNGYQVLSSDLRDTPEIYGEKGKNFFQAFRAKAPVQITNPPYFLAENWIRHSREIGCHTFALLLKANFFHTEKKQKLFAEMPPSMVLAIPWPVNFEREKGHAAILDFSWVVWEHGVTETKFSVLPKPRGVLTNW